MAGRRRWRIENEGFDVQKNHGFHLEHIFSYNYNAIQNHYYLIQIAYTLMQLLINGIKIIRENFKSLKKTSRNLLETFNSILTFQQSSLGIIGIAMQKIKEVYKIAHTKILFSEQLWLICTKTHLFPIHKIYRSPSPYQNFIKIVKIKKFIRHYWL